MNASISLTSPTVAAINEESDELARRARKSLRDFSVADNPRAVGELILTSTTWLALLSASYWVAPISAFLSLGLAVIGGLFWVRLFIIQHDMGHGSFFSSAKANRLAGSVIGVFTLTPFARWKASHAAHHATSGNLSERSWSRDVYLMTVGEFHASPPWLRLAYRVYRHRLVLFFVLAPLVFLAEHRRYTKTETAPSVRRSVWFTNAALALLGTILFLTLEPMRLLQVLVPFYLLGAAIGVWLFYVQHQFADAYWAPGHSYSAAAASLRGSSVLRLPPTLAWLTGYIGIHHIHHLAPRIPSYRLNECDRANPELAIGPQFTLFNALIHARGDLWDPNLNQLVTFGRRTVRHP